jgi:glycosyltransferase involved in cell wall biosynthesis
MNQESALQPSISVAMATCNGAPFIRQQIDSILAQDLPPAEIVVCDDCSTDGTAELLSDLHAAGKIRYYPNAERLGVTGNFKRAVSLCRKGNWVALSDQDDVWQPDKLRSTAALMEQITNDDRPALVFSDLEMTDESLQTIRPSFWKMLQIDPARETLQSLLFGNIVTGCSTLLNPAMAEILCGMPEQAGVMHDNWIALAGFSFGRHAFSPAALVRYRQHGANVTFDTNKADGPVSRALKNLRQLVQSSSYLEKEITTARLFFEQYGSRMTPGQQATFREFTRLSRAGFFRKKSASLRARSYRYAGGH